MKCIVTTVISRVIVFVPKYLSQRSFSAEFLDVQDYGDVQIAHRKYCPEYPKNMRNYGQIVGTVANLARSDVTVLKVYRLSFSIWKFHFQQSGTSIKRWKNRSHNWWRSFGGNRWIQTKITFINCKKLIIFCFVLTSITGSIGAHLKHNKNIAVIWVDAHADINTNLTSLTGNIHGMTVALLAKELESYWPKLPGMDWLETKWVLKPVVEN